MYIGIKKVTAMSDFRLMLIFDNGEQRIFDVKPLLDQGIFRDLKDPSLFNSARVSFDTVEWINGADLCPEFLYQESVPLPLVAQA